MSFEIFGFLRGDFFKFRGSPKRGGGEQIF